MDNTTVEALETFGTTVSGSVKATDVLKIVGIGLTAGVAIYLVVWAAGKIVRVFVNALNGHLGV